MQSFRSSPCTRRSALQRYVWTSAIPLLLRRRRSSSSEKPDLIASGAALGRLDKDVVERSEKKKPTMLCEQRTGKKTLNESNHWERTTQ
jgi:hypothetical protein